MRVPDPRGVERSRVSRRAHVARAYPASREGGPECCVYASPRVRAGACTPGTLRRARAAQSAVCTRVRAGTPTALSPVWGW